MKKVQDGDENEIIREPKALRTVNMKNCDAKSVAFVANGVVATPLAEKISPAQRGFIRGRQFVHNVVEVDAGAREADMRQELGALLPLDIENAFPALSQQFLFEVIEQAGLQAGLGKCYSGLLFECGRLRFFRRRSPAVSFLASFGHHAGVPPFWLHVCFGV